jgi:hypothetical protein
MHWIIGVSVSVFENIDGKPYAAVYLFPSILQSNIYINYYCYLKMLCYSIFFILDTRI